MELQAIIVCAVPNACWLEYIPQLDLIAPEGMTIYAGRARASPAPGLGIGSDWHAIAREAAMTTIDIQKGKI